MGYCGRSAGTCVAYDSIFLQRTVPVIEVQPADSVAICRGDSIQLAANNNVNGAGLLWSPASGLDIPTAERPIATPLENTTYVATIDLNGCAFRDSVFIDVAAFDFPAVISDTTICENFGVQLAETIHPDSTTTIFQWVPADGLNDDTIAAPLAFPTETTTYQLIAAAANGACADTASVTVAVLAADVDIANPDTIEICRGDSVALSASTNTGEADGLLWSPDDGSLSSSSGLVA
ncbi:MAG: hypothetical protein H6558_15850 [Lewinellaceae bacterium]|nr:hypothetical protein [Lewinellaceae bacterium]